MEDKSKIADALQTVNTKPNVGLLTCDEVEICDTKIGSIGARYRLALTQLKDCILMCENHKRGIENLKFLAGESFNSEDITALEEEVNIVLNYFNVINSSSKSLSIQ